MMRALAILVLLAAPAMAEVVLHNGRVIWSVDQDNFGGFSGIDIQSNGSFVALSDRATAFTGLLEFTGGILTGISLDETFPLKDSQGKALDKRNTDSEGLAVLADGSFLISFESNDRIMHHKTLDGPGEFLPKHPDFSSLSYNNGLEALAVGSDGTVYAIPEINGTETSGIPIYRLRGEIWDTDLKLPYDEIFSPTGADIGPDGFLYYLDRSFEMFGGFNARIRRVALEPDAIPETLHEFGLTTNNNFEGISVWADATGQNHMTVISDDNFNFFQSTQIVDFLLN